MLAYDTLSGALEDLKERGFTLDFNIDLDQIVCHTDGTSLRPDEFEIVEVYRFEGDSNPDDEEVVYAISSLDGSCKGVLVSAYGMYAGDASQEMIQKLAVHH
jgi:hypothetical protein